MVYLLAFAKMFCIVWGGVLGILVLMSPLFLFVWWLGL